MSHPIMRSHWYHHINFIDSGDIHEKDSIIYSYAGRV